MDGWLLYFNMILWRNWYTQQAQTLWLKNMWVQIPPELLKTYTATSYFCKFMGSNPITSMLAYVVKWLRQLSEKQSFTFYMSCYAQIAQLVEQGTENPCVTSSILVLSTFILV